MNEPGKEDKVTGVHKEGQVDVLIGDSALESRRLDLKNKTKMTQCFNKLGEFSLQLSLKSKTCLKSELLCARFTDTLGV